MVRLAACATGALGAVARLALAAGTARAAELTAALDFFGHRSHLLFCRQPERAIAHVATVRSWCPEKAHVQGLQLSAEILEFGDSPLGVRNLVSDQMS